MPFATLGPHPATGASAIADSRIALGREVGQRTTAILAELQVIADRMAAGEAVTEAEVLHAADRIAALRVTIACSAMLDAGA